MTNFPKFSLFTSMPPLCVCVCVCVCVCERERVGMSGIMA